MPPTKLLTVPAVADLRQRIEHWRSTRMKRGPMSRELWAEAASLARKHGVYGVSKTLRLNFEALKSWAEDSKKERRAAAPPPAFVQIDPLAAVSPPCSVVELQCPSGAKMTIRLGVSAAMDVASLVDSFWSRRR